MANNWDILTKELAVHGFRLQQDGHAIEYISQKQSRIVPIQQAGRLVESEIQENAKTLDSLWQQASQIVQQNSQQHAVHDPRMASLFIHALKDLSKILDCFDERGLEAYKQAFRGGLSRDITSFSHQQVDELTDLKITIDWVWRLVQRLLYIRRLLILVLKGSSEVNAAKQVTAQGVSGPWANLDLPMGQRVVPFREEEENLKGREGDIRNQERYTKGFEAYNNDGRVGQGHYWREIANEPSSWQTWMQDKENQHRSVLFWN